MIVKRIKLNVKGKEYSVEIDQAGEDATKIKVDEKEFIFREKRKGKKRAGVAKTSPPKRNFKRKNIKAPIGGIISEIFVKENDFVKKGKNL